VDDGDSSRNPEIYEMKAMTFGSTSSPCSAQYAKNKNAMEFAEEFPEAAMAITERHYVDDYFDSAHTDDEARKRRSDVTELHGRGGFLIRSWTCSSLDVLKNIPMHLQAGKNHKPNLIGEETERVLGIHWNSTKDCFTYLVNYSKVPKDVLNGTKNPTKREMLTLLMSLFDPLGFLSNYTVAGKILLQDVWRLEIGWDDELSGPLLHKWNSWISELPKVTKLETPRCYSMQIKSCAKRELTSHLL